MMKCQLLMTGHELMTGVTVDSNSAWMAEQLVAMGININKMVTVDDSLDDLVREIRQACKDHQLLIINGGLGPTSDDLTAEALAQLSEKPLQLNSSAEQHVHNWCEKRGIHANSANLKQALLPADAQLIPNANGSAVGIAMEYDKCLILCTPGVPSEMKQMMSDEIIPDLLQRYPDVQQQFTKRLQVFGMGESSIQHKVHTELPDWPETIGLGFRAGFPTLELKLTARDKSHIALRDQWQQKLESLLGSVIFAEGADTLGDVVVKALTAQGAHITTAESCTGGLIASNITAIAGASAVFEAGFVTYCNEMKQQMLGVKATTLAQHGAVSEAVVREMAQGALDKSNADYAIAVSGIAGPDGGTEEKPVGTVWAAWGKKGHIKANKLFYPAERKMFQTLVAAYGLDLIRREILGITEQPRYLR